MSNQPDKTHGTPVLQLVDVHKNFGVTPIIRGLNLEVRQGERHAVIGPNGAGKSTTFHLVSGRFPVSSGQILLKGETINDEEELADFKSRQEKKQEVLLVRAKRELQEILEKEDLGGDDLNAALADDDDEDDDDDD